MKIFFALIAIIVLIGCRGTKFNYASDNVVENDLGTPTSIVIDSTYSLYLRQVIKVKDQVSKRYVPQNGDLVPGAKLIEVEYLLYSDIHKKVLVLTNIPDNKMKFYNSQDKLLDFSPAAKETKIDIWYLRQFRFGDVLDNSRLQFTNIEGGQTKHIWNIERLDEGKTIRVNSLSQGDEFGEELRTIAAAFSLEIIFKKVEAFKFVFKDNASKSINTRTVGETDLPNQTFYIYQKGKKKFIVFRFDSPLKNGFDNVIFFTERLYATWK